ncbi:MAG: hypothetical protein ACLF0P_14355 [Thermoanaerobaculia bacterium]
MSHDDSVKGSLSKFSEVMERREREEEKRRSGDRERRGKHEEEWRSICDEVLVPLFQEYEAGAALGLPENVTIRTRPRLETVSLYVEWPRGTHVLEYSLDRAKGCVWRRGLPAHSPFTKDSVNAPVCLEFRDMSRERLEDSVNKVLSLIASGRLDRRQ